MTLEVFVIDDEKKYRDTVLRALEPYKNRGVSILEFEDGQAAKAQAHAVVDEMALRIGAAAHNGIRSRL